MDAGVVILLFVAIGYLIYRVHRLEQLLGGQARGRRPGSGPSKVVPILRNGVEPGPFKPGTRRRNPETDS